MFEDSLVESRAGSVSANKRWTALASISLQFAVAGIVIVLPLLHPEALPFHTDTPKVLLALPPRPPVQVVRVEPESAASTRLAAPRVVQTMSPLLQGRNTSANEAPTLVPSAWEWESTMNYPPPSRSRQVTGQACPWLRRELQPARFTSRGASRRAC